MRWGKGGWLLLVLSSAVCAQPARDLADLSLEELANIEITSVSRRAERLADAPASIYVITNEDIRRSGATSLPEALRLAPNLNVARVDAFQYAISARGFNNSIGNKLLVLIDGRTVYTPLFSGVFWDQQDVMLEDVERIEVISGPGATLWGANAVNGVINVTTRSARDTQGGLLVAGGGNLEAGGAYRHGGALGAEGAYRAYAKVSQLQNTKQARGTAVPDGRDWGQAGFRADWGSRSNAFTLQGDAYSSRAEDRGVVLGFPLRRVEASGANLLARWTRQLSESSDFQLQAYYDQAKREDAVLFQPDAQIFDLELQHGIRGGAHRFVWGGGYRSGRDTVEDGILTGFRPKSKELEWYNVYAQDEFRLSETLELTAGIKLEHNDYTGTEYLPSVRLAWKPTPERLVWGAASRAVRAPSRLDREVMSPLFGNIAGGPNFESEVADVYELGYRAQETRSFTWSATFFHHEWDRLRSGTSVPVFIVNQIQGQAYGVEAWAAWQVARGWRLSGGFFTLRKNLELEPGSTDPVGVNNPNLANDPEYQWTARSSHDLGARQELEIAVRHVGKLSTPVVPAYTALDLRWGWKVSRDLQLSVTVQNAADPSHPEFGAAPARSEIARGFLVAAKWTH
jgi:iron complex outermembrane recepter protein